MRQVVWPYRGKKFHITVTNERTLCGYSIARPGDIYPSGIGQVIPEDSPYQREPTCKWCIQIESTL